MIASTLLGVRPPRLPVAALVRAGSLFAISEGSIRTCLSRMLAAGELALRDGRYELAGALLARANRQDESRTARTTHWDGQWRILVVSGERARPAVDRAAIRLTLSRVHFAELREGVWTRPADRSPPSVEGGTWFLGRPELVIGGDAKLAARLWPLASWAKRGRSLAADVARWQPALDAHDSEALAPTFVVDAAVLRHLQVDPRLPSALLPPGWPGDELRDAYERFDAAFKETWKQWAGQQTGNRRPSEGCGRT